MKNLRVGVLALVITAIGSTASAHAPGELASEIDKRVAQAEAHVVQWRRTLHEHPELSNREFQTAKLIADQLGKLGLEVRTGVAHTGVIGILRGGKPGPVVALRADMDALPISTKIGETTGLPFASKVVADYKGDKVNVVHACGHDAHVAILLGVAEVLAAVRGKLSGTVTFIFQPAEEGPPEGEQGGARFMIEQGALTNPVPSAIFGLHVWPEPTGTISYRPGRAMAASDRFKITVKGKQTHGSEPWSGVDAVLIASHIVVGLQDIVARQVNLVQTPAVISVGTIHGGSRANILAGEAELEGTIRTFDEGVRGQIAAAIQRTATNIAESGGGTALVSVSKFNPGVDNKPELTTQLLPTLQRVAGKSNVHLGLPVTGSEDFGDYQSRVPGLFVFLGVIPKGKDPVTAPHNHAPDFTIDEAALPLGVRTLASLAVDYLSLPKPTR